MPDISMLIKPASSQCNLRCRYCFYHDEAQSREKASFGMMDEKTLDTVVRRAVSESSGRVAFSFQGGEPTVRGIEYFELLHEKCDYYKRSLGRADIEFSFSIQTNGILTASDERWAELFSRYHYLVGLSVDGTKDIHDENRIDAAGRGTFARVEAAARALGSHGVDFNILTVVSGQLSRRIAAVYAAYKKRGWNYMQFIPCLEPLGEAPFESAGALTPQRYLVYSKTLFDLWYADNASFIAGSEKTRVSVRKYDNLLQIALGQRPESCGMSGICSIQFVIEADGGVYPCDFYVLDDYKLGNIRDMSFRELYECSAAQNFVKSSLSRPERCAECKALALCGGGCRRYRFGGEYIYCEQERELAEYIAPRLTALARDYRSRFMR